MFTVFRAIYIVLLFFRSQIVLGLSRLISSVVVWKAFFVFVTSVVLPIVGSFVLLKVGSYVTQYSLTYLDENVSKSDIPAYVQLTGIAAYLYEKLGLAQAISIVLTAATIRFGLSMTFFRK